MPDQSLRLLVDLTAMRPGGEGGGIKPALLEMLRWLGRHGAERLHFVYAANAETVAEVTALARTTDTIIETATASAETAALLGCDLVYCPFGVTDLACPGIPTVTLVVDLLHQDFPITLPDPDRIYREQKFAAAVAVTDRFQVISDYTGSRLREHYAVSPARVFRTYLPIHDRLTTTGGPIRPFFFYPANFWIHKNHDALLAAYALYRRDADADAWPLVLVGHPHESRLASLKELARSLGIEADVIFKGYVFDEELAACYRTAGALVFPSQHEGFGIPLLEAMAFGVPIIANNVTAIPEITGAAALLVDARQPAALAAAMQRIAGEPELRVSLSAQGYARLSHFSADAEFGKLLDSLFAVAREPARCRHLGYYPVDGLTAPRAIFALPAVEREVTLVLTTRPLGVARTLQIACGGKILTEHVIPADRPETLSLTFLPGARALTLGVPDANSLSATDPRIHGILLEELQVQTADGEWHDLLNPSLSRAPTAPPFVRRAAEVPAEPAKYLWKIESPLPARLPDGCLEIRGWCLRPDNQPAMLRLKVAGMDWQVAANLPRPDVQAAYPEQKSAACGFGVRLRVPAGRHELVIESVESNGEPIQLKRHRLAVPFFAAWHRTFRWEHRNLLAFQLMAGPSMPPRRIKPERFPAVAANPPRRPRFAIVTPSYQQGQFLEQTMRGVVEQECVAGEYVVQDGGSTDRSVMLLQRCALEQGAGSKDRGAGPTGDATPPFSPSSLPPSPQNAGFAFSWVSAPDKGQADAIARGFAKTTGEPDDLMAWINSDDFYLPGALAFVADYFAHHPAVDVLYGNRILIDERSREIGRWFLPAHDDAVLRLNDFVPQEAMFWRRRIWEKAGGLDTSFNFAMDWDLLLRFQNAGARIVHVPKFLGCFRIHPAQKTLAAMHDSGQREIDLLRARANGRTISQTELENDPRLVRYLRRSALLELGRSLSLRQG